MSQFSAKTTRHAIGKLPENPHLRATNPNPASRDRQSLIKQTKRISPDFSSVQLITYPALLYPKLFVLGILRKSYGRPLPTGGN